MELLYMITGFGYLTPDGVKFTREHPFQLVGENEVATLLSEGRFKIADAGELADYYKIGELQ